MRPQVHPDGAEPIGQAAGQRVEQPRAEPVGVEQQQGLAGTAPVQRGDPQTVVLDGARCGF